MSKLKKFRARFRYRDANNTLHEKFLDAEMPSQKAMTEAAIQWGMERGWGDFKVDWFLNEVRQVETFEVDPEWKQSFYRIDLEAPELQKSSLGGLFN